jgi:membrane-associated protein
MLKVFLFILAMLLCKGGATEIFTYIFEFIINLEENLSEIVTHFGVWTYLILFLVIFCETGLFMAPFLPGDSLLFVLGALATVGTLELNILLIVIMFAAILGDTLNYRIGKLFGHKLFNKENARFFNKKHVISSRKFYEKHGGKTIIIARFLPIIRTFAPFVAGMGSMVYGRFIVYNIIGGITWVGTCILAGYFFGNIPAVKENFALVIIAIVGVSIIPGCITWIKSRKKSPKK